MTDHRTAVWEIPAIAVAPVLAAVIGSAFNIWYNGTQIEPLLNESQWQLFQKSVAIYNVAAIGIWLWRVLSLRPALKSLNAGHDITGTELQIARVRAINLPWSIVGIMGIGWALCIPALLIGLQQSAEPVDRRVLFHLPTSVVISGLLTVTNAFFVVELLVGRLIFPVLFRDQSPADTPGAIGLPLSRRNMLCAIAACVCPVLSLVLLEFVDATSTHDFNWFMVFVSAFGISLGLFCSWMVSNHVVQPILELRNAAQRVSAGDLQVRIDLPRADEFGPLIDDFNEMIDGLRARRELRKRFGLHVGRRTAELILAQNPGQTGSEQDITVMFCDIRNFTARCAVTPAEEIVPLLNRFLSVMVEVVEDQHGGTVNKFLGDGFMALFGIGESDSDGRSHAKAAVNAGLDMIDRLADLNAELSQGGLPELGIGIGVHTGTAIVGSMGSSERLEYTAIGDTVNVASRVEGLTKKIGRPLLVTEEVSKRLPPEYRLTQLPAEPVKGQSAPIRILAVDSVC
ncbi:MAG: adenylate/guanylate cyclase domain-containing protein [Planctomycetota bacterium]|jgi:adenylate cyclase